MRDLLTVFLCWMHLVTGGKILLLPGVFKSHMSYFGFLGKELAKRGHEIHMVHSPGLPTPKAGKEGNFTVLHWEVREPEMTELNPEEAVEVARLILQFPIDTVVGAQLFQDQSRGQCTNPLSDVKLFRTLESNKYDFAILDPFIMSRCLGVLLYRLDIPFATLVTQYEPMLCGIPALPSFVPFAMRRTYTEQMTFWQRFMNLLMTVEWSLFPRLFQCSDSLISTYAPEKPPISMNQMVRQSQLWLLNTDIAIDYPRPIMPHIVNIGGLTSGPAMELPEKFESFLQDAGNGAILLTFGSIVTVMPPEINEMLLTAFARIKQKVIWMYNGTNIQHVPQNVLISKWIPQNDLLGHPKVKLFITHGGNNGQFEALYHGVPMIVCPIFGEQRYNANRIRYKGYGIIMSLNHMTSEELVANIKEVIENPSYRKAIQLGSQIYHSAPMTAAERAVYWIEHVMKFGGDHLRSASLDMPWYQYWMLDVLTFIVAFFILLCSIFLRITKFIVNIMCGQKSKKEKQE